MDVEAAFGPGVRCERRAVCVGDGADDGEAALDRGVACDRRPVCVGDAGTVARPSPFPCVWLTRSVPRRWNGWKSLSTWPGGINAPVFAIAIIACPPVAAVEISTRPPSRLCRMALW